MENIYRSWIEFNKKQNLAFKGLQARSILENAESSVQLWKDSDYPKGEDWKYVKYNHLPETHFLLPEEDFESQQVADQFFTTIEIKNFTAPRGFNGSALPEGLQITSELESAEVKPSLDSLDNPFLNLSSSFYGLGLNFKFTRSYKNEKPVKILFDLNSFAEKSLFLQQNLNFIFEDHSRADVFFEIQGETFSGLCNICLTAQVGASSEVRFFSKELGGPQSHFVMNWQSQVQKQGVFKSLDITLNSKWSRHNVSVALKDEEAQGELYGSYLNHSNHFVDHHTLIDHQVGRTESREDYRGILTDHAQAVFNGKIVIAKGASQSNSEQINKNLMLSNTAEIDTKPELQIDNDDVKAAHGATVGQIDEEQSFYLQSRGYSAEQAKRVLAKAFIYDLLEQEGDVAKSFFGSDIEKTLKSMEGNRDL